MDITGKLEATMKKQQGLVERINLMEQEKQQLLQEALRLDGEIRVLRLLINEHSKEKGSGEEKEEKVDCCHKEETED